MISEREEKRFAGLALARKRVSSRRNQNSFAHSVKGFTLVEIIITLVILGIISAVTIGRFSDGNAFNGVVLRDQIVALTRMAQQSALGRAGVELRVTPDGNGDATVRVSETAGVMQNNTISIASVNLSADIDATTSCSVSSGTPITSGAPLVIEFGELGDVMSAGVGAPLSSVTRSVRICIDNQPETSVCVSSAGFAYVGDCDVD